MQFKPPTTLLFEAHAEQISELYMLHKQMQAYIDYKRSRLCRTRCFATLYNFDFPQLYNCSH